MSAIITALEKRRQQGEKSLIVYITAGCPDYETSRRAVLAAVEAGADAVEIGLPFSDPMADGPVLQAASTLALEKGATTGKALELVRSLYQETKVPLLTMAYANTIIQYGVERFMKDFAEAGLQGVIIPDMPMEEEELGKAPCKAAGMDWISFLAPTTDERRMEKICGGASGFVYCLAVTGVTGVRQMEYQTVSAVMEKARRYTQLPLAVGFGIGDGESARRAAVHGDAVIVGSALMNRLMAQGVEGVGELVKEIRQALDEAGKAAKA